MNFYDHLIRFDDEDAAKADPTIGTYWSDETGWDTSRMLTSASGLSVSAITGEHEVTDPDTGETHMEPTLQPLPYFYVCLCLPQVDEDLKARAMIVADRDNDAILHSLIPVEQLAGFRITPVIAGMSYAFSG